MFPDVFFALDITTAHPSTILIKNINSVSFTSGFTWTSLYRIFEVYPTP